MPAKISMIKKKIKKGKLCSTNMLDTICLLCCIGENIFTNTHV